MQIRSLHTTGIMPRAHVHTPPRRRLAYSTDSIAHSTGEDNPRMTMVLPCIKVGLLLQFLQRLFVRLIRIGFHEQHARAKLGRVQAFH